MSPSLQEGLCNGIEFLRWEATSPSRLVNAPTVLTRGRGQWAVRAAVWKAVHCLFDKGDEAASPGMQHLQELGKAGSACSRSPGGSSPGTPLR